MPALSSLKSNRTRAKTALAKEEEETNTLLQSELTELNDDREIDRYLLSIGKVILNLETKLARLEMANEKLMDALEQNEDTTLAEEFQDTLDEDAELTDAETFTAKDTKGGSRKETKIYKLKTRVKG